jgi:hypothetical protein
MDFLRPLFDVSGTPDVLIFVESYRSREARRDLAKAYDTILVSNQVKMAGKSVGMRFAVFLS